MTKFEGLRVLAVERRLTFLEYPDEMDRFANELIAGLRKYLGSTDGTVLCCEVDRNHAVIGDPSPIVQACFCCDTFWYFELVFQFPASEAAAIRLCPAVVARKR